ncbi:hypothetical protein Tco_1193470 [Tanacetum coccineum]
MICEVRDGVFGLVALKDKQQGSALVFFTNRVTAAAAAQSAYARMITICSVFCIQFRDADHFSNDTENPNEYIGLKINDMLTANSNMMNENSECNGSPIMAGDIIHFNTVNLLELSDLETSENHSAAKDLSAEVIEENISTVIGRVARLSIYLLGNAHLRVVSCNAKDTEGVGLW